MTNVSIEAVPATTKKKRRGPLGEVLFRYVLEEDV